MKEGTKREREQEEGQSETSAHREGTKRDTEPEGSKADTCTQTNTEPGGVKREDKCT